ncbi:MAG TPA: CotH kinase family protein, partial [Candidatus Saccharimonadales bacterium]|nr:CotH kinase family protein [Candidatus Saccharimonadales bacterium]
RRTRRLGKKTVLAAWLFHVSAVACRKLGRRGIRRLYSWRQKPSENPNSTLWESVAPKLEAGLHRLSAAQQNAVLLRVVLSQPWEAVSTILHTSEQRARKHVDGGLKKLARRLQTKARPITMEALADACSREGCTNPLPAGLAESVLLAVEESLVRKPIHKLANRTLRTLAWRRWRKRILIGAPAAFVSLAIVLGGLWYADSRTGHSHSLSVFVVSWVRFEVWKLNRLIGPAAPWPVRKNNKFPSSAIGVHQAQDMYQTTNIWPVHLSFTLEQWEGLSAHYIGPMPNFTRHDGLWQLRNPNAKRGGLAGVLGYEFSWGHADAELGGLSFSNVAARAKGNLVSVCWPKRSFKLDLNKYTKGQKLAGLDELTFNSLVWDSSRLSDALGYEFFRDAGVPAPRTAYAWLSTSVEDRWVRKPLGLYLMVETVGQKFIEERFGSKNTPLFKPSTYELFAYLGEDWSVYSSIYNLKTKATPAKLERIIGLARLVSSGSDGDFQKQAGEYLNLDELARFLAAEVLLSHYDGILLDGQNFYMYLHPGSNKFGFIPWDLDSAWGNFWIGSKPELERASIWHPWVGKNRFLEKVMSLPEFRKIYRAHLEELMLGPFQPARLEARIDELAAVIRDPIAAESGFLLKQFEQSISKRPVRIMPGESERGINQPAHQLKRFIEARYKSVRKQLDGTSSGVILKTPAEK